MFVPSFLITTHLKFIENPKFDVPNIFLTTKNYNYIKIILLLFNVYLFAI